MGMTLVERDLKSMKIEVPFGRVLEYEILQLFPFTSESKRMGIIVKVSLRIYSVIQHVIVPGVTIIYKFHYIQVPLYEPVTSV